MKGRSRLARPPLLWHRRRDAFPGLERDADESLHGQWRRLWHLFSDARLARDDADEVVQGEERAGQEGQEEAEEQSCRHRGEKSYPGKLGLHV